MVNENMRYVWLAMAAFAGAITALSFRSFQKMSKAEIFLALCVGTSFAIFVGPWIATLFFGEGPIDIRLWGGIFYLLASGSNILIPMAVRAIGRVFGQVNGTQQGEQP